MAQSETISPYLFKVESCCLLVRSLLLLNHVWSRQLKVVPEIYFVTDFFFFGMVAILGHELRFYTARLYLN
jgi:hypothetical protein